MPLTASIVAMADQIKVVLEANLGALGLKKVYYGERILTPDFPSAEVEAGPKTRGFATTRQYDIGARVYVTLYVGKIQDPTLTTRETDLLAESVETILHASANQQLGGLVIFGYVERMEPGLVRTPRGLYVKGTRLTWLGASRQAF